MKKPEDIENKDKQEDKNKENNRDNNPSYKNSINNIYHFLRILVCGQIYTIIMSILTLFFENAIVSSKVVVSQVMGINIGFMIIAVYLIFKK